MKLMNITRAALAVFVLTALAFSSVGQEAEEEAPPEAPEAEESAPEQPDTRPLDEIFIPSEEIAADEEIVFPVNI